jgi:hypothetical protein
VYGVRDKGQGVRDKEETENINCYLILLSFNLENPDSDNRHADDAD